MKLTHRQRSLLWAAALWSIFVVAQVHHAVAHHAQSEASNAAP